MASAVGERLPLIGAILIPRYMTVGSVFAEERALEVFFAEVAMEPNIEVLCRKRKPNSLCRVAEVEECAGLGLPG
jgi:hypothetical protein